jgi:hypothetical protein
MALAVRRLNYGLEVRSGMLLDVVEVRDEVGRIASVKVRSPETATDGDRAKLIVSELTRARLPKFLIRDDSDRAAVLRVASMWINDPQLHGWICAKAAIIAADKE